MTMEEYVKDRRPVKVLKDKHRSLKLYPITTGIIVEDENTGECRGLGADYLWQCGVPEEEE